MDRFNRLHSTATRRKKDGWRWPLSGLALATVLLFGVPNAVLAADWLAPGSDQTMTSPWVKDLTVKLEQDQYRNVWMNALGNSPQAVIVRYLNNADQALRAGNKPLAQSYVDRTIELFENGVNRGYYSRSDVEPLVKLIRTSADAAMKGGPVAATAQEFDRWTGYTHNKPLGLTNEDSRVALEHPNAK